MRALPFVVLAVVVAAPSGHAQELASSFDQLRVLVKPGDTIVVRDTAGREVKGSIAELSQASLVLLVGQDRRDISSQEVSVIRQRRPDSLANGAKWGFGIGAGLGLLGVAAVASEVEGADAAWGALAILLYGGIGAGVGVGIDAMITTEQVIFARGSPPAQPKDVLSASARRRLVVSLRF